jgi:hypothetical protein
MTSRSVRESTRQDSLEEAPPSRTRKSAWSDSLYSIFEDAGRLESCQWSACRAGNSLQSVSGSPHIIGSGDSSCAGEHLQKNISEAYNGLDVSFDEFPKEGKTDPDAYKTAIDALPRGSASKNIFPKEELTLLIPNSHDFHPRHYSLSNRPVRNRTRHPRPHHQARRQTPRTPPSPPRLRKEAQCLRLHRAPQALRPGLRRRALPRPETRRLQLLLLVHEPAQEPARDV